MWILLTIALITLLYSSFPFYFVLDEPYVDVEATQAWDPED